MEPALYPSVRGLGVFMRIQCVQMCTRPRGAGHRAIFFLFFVMGTEMVLLEKKNVFATITGVLGKMATSQVKRKDSVPSKGWLRFSEV